MPAWPPTPPQTFEPWKLSLAIHKPAVVTSMPSAPSPRSLVGLKVSKPVLGDRPSIPGAEMAPGPASLQPFAFCDHANEVPALNDLDQSRNIFY